jgi:glutamate racemase
LNLKANILLIGTPSTIKSNFYFEEFSELGFNNIHSLATLGLAGLIETSDPVTRHNLDQEIHNNLTESIKNDHKRFRIEFHKIRAVFNICTHYPLVEDNIRSSLEKFGLPKNIIFPKQGEMVANKLYDYLKRHPEFAISPGDIFFFQTKKQDNLERWVKFLLNIDGKISFVDNL